MKMRIQLIIENESGLSTTAEIAAIERADTDDLIGISLEEAKTMTGGVPVSYTHLDRPCRAAALQPVGIGRGAFEVFIGRITPCSQAAHLSLIHI